MCRCLSSQGVFDRARGPAIGTATAGRRDLQGGISSPGQFLLRLPLDDQETAICITQASPALHQSLSCGSPGFYSLDRSGEVWSACACRSLVMEGGLHQERELCLSWVAEAWKRTVIFILVTAGFWKCSALGWGFGLLSIPLFFSPDLLSPLQLSEPPMSTLSCSSGGSDLSVPNIFHAATR